MATRLGTLGRGSIKPDWLGSVDARRMNHQQDPQFQHIQCLPREWS
jgi:hypothetical protein